MKLPLRKAVVEFWKNSVSASPSWSTRNDWKRFTFSDRLVAGVDGPPISGKERFATFLAFLQWHGWLCAIINNFIATDRSKSTVLIKGSFIFLYLPGIFRGTFLRHIQYTMLANRWTWTFSYRRIPEFRRGRSRTRIHGICWLIYHRRDIRIDRSTGSFYFRRCERSNRSRQCRNHLWTQRGRNCTAEARLSQVHSVEENFI